MSREEYIKQLKLYTDYLTSIKNNHTTEDVEYNISVNQLNALNLVKYGLILNPNISIKIGEPETEIIKSFYYHPKSYFSKNLNESQKDAVIKALNMNDLLIVQGPPGTGKTTVIAEIVQQLKRKEPNARFLITSASHLAVNNVIESLSENKANLSMIRIRTITKNKTIKQFEIDNYLEHYFASFKGSQSIKTSLEKYYSKNIRRVIKDLTKNFDLVAVTLNAIIGTKFDFTNVFDYVIIDEVAKSTLPEICSCLVFAKKVILIGDNKQLPPIITSDSDNNDEIARYLDRNGYIEYLFTHIHSSSKAFLNKQFRMSNNIGNFISDEFYQNPRLLNGADKPNDDGLNYVTYNIDQTISDSTHNNETEADIVERIIPLLPKGKKVAIISPYKVQIEDLEKRFRGTDVLVGTIDSFQGQGVDIVICTVNRNDGNSSFIANPNRINVAISRAKEQFWLVGNKEYLSKIKIYKDYYCYSKNNKSLVNSYFYDGNDIIKQK